MNVQWVCAIVFTDDLMVYLLLEAVKVGFDGGKNEISTVAHWAAILCKKKKKKLECLLIIIFFQISQGTNSIVYIK